MKMEIFHDKVNIFPLKSTQYVVKNHDCNTKQINVKSKEPRF